MALVAGLAHPDHPWHGLTQPGPAGLGLILDLDARGPTRRVRYETAAAWCAAGACLPVSWTWPLEDWQVAEVPSARTTALHGAIQSVAGRLEWAFSVRRPAQEAPDPGGMPESGSAYLAALRRRAPLSVRLEAALRRSAGGRPFALGSVSERADRLTGVVVGEREHDAFWRDAIETTLADLTGAQPDIAGPLPPFASGLLALKSVGLHPVNGRSH